MVAKHRISKAGAKPATSLLAISNAVNALDKQLTSSRGVIDFNGLSLKTLLKQVGCLSGIMDKTEGLTEVARSKRRSKTSRELSDI